MTTTFEIFGHQLNKTDAIKLKDELTKWLRLDRTDDKAKLTRIMAVTCSHFDIEHHALTDAYQGALNENISFAEVRMIAYRLARENTTLTLKEIGDAFNRIHCTVQYGIQKITEINSTYIQTQYKLIKSKL